MNFEPQSGQLWIQLVHLESINTFLDEYNLTPASKSGRDQEYDSLTECLYLLQNDSSIVCGRSYRQTAN